MVKTVESFCKGLLALLMSLLVLIIFFQVLNRFAFHLPAAWTEEMGRFVFVWTSVIGISLGVSERAHIGLTIIVKLFPDKIGRLLLILAEIVMIAFYLFLVICGSIWAFYGFQETSETVRWLPMFFVYIGIPFSGLLMLIFSSSYLIKMLSKKEIFQEDLERIEEF